MTDVHALLANMQLIQRALMNQDQVVAVEHFRTPTAQLADFILPGDAWPERNCISDGFGWTSIYRPSQKVVAPCGCRGVFDFWRDLAHRMGMADYFAWDTNEQLLDHRLADLRARNPEPLMHISPVDAETVNRGSVPPAHPKPASPADVAAP